MTASETREKTPRCLICIDAWKITCMAKHKIHWCYGKRMKSLTLLFQNYETLPLMNIFCSIQTWFYNLLRRFPGFEFGETCFFLSQAIRIIFLPPPASEGWYMLIYDPLVGAQPRPYCSFARHLVGKIVIHCTFAHHQAQPSICFTGRFWCLPKKMIRQNGANLGSSGAICYINPARDWVTVLLAHSPLFFFGISNNYPPPIFGKIRKTQM